MDTMYLPAAPEIRETFEQEVIALGGTVPDVYAEGDLLFARAVLPGAAEVRPGDRIHGGIALRTHDTEVLVHPYTYRVVCTNGAIAAFATGSRVVERVEVAAPSTAINAVLDDLRAAVRACATPATLDATVSTMRSATQRDADVMLHMLPVLPHMPPGVRASLLRTIVRRFEAGRDRSVFGLVNAVTSVARDTSDPEIRWRLEELGGGMLARLPERPRAAAPATEVAESVGRVEGAFVAAGTTPRP
ncbi:MAG: hypothetical protein ABR499_21840 [Gemmatimonadaceae bacterium]